MRQQYRDRGVWSRHIIRSRYFGAYMRASDWYGIWNGGSRATYWNGAKNLISTTVYSIACKFDALTDMEELHIQKSSDLPNNTLSISLKYGASILNMKLQPNGPWIWRLQIAHVRATHRATDACQIGKERVLSAGLSVQIQSDAFATERPLRRSDLICM